MADTDFGLSFSPLTPDGNKPRPDQYDSGQAGGSSPLQEAIQILSLRRPRVYGAQAPAPTALLNSAGGNGRPDFSALMQTLMQSFGQGQQGPSPMAPQQATFPRPLPPIPLPGMPRPDVPLPMPGRVPPKPSFNFDTQPPAPGPNPMAPELPPGPRESPVLRRQV